MQSDTPSARKKRRKPRVPNTAWQTPPQFAEQLGVSPEKVIGWITRGELGAVNVAHHATGRARWRIPPEAQQEFFARRAPQPTSTPHRKRRSLPAGIVRHFRN